MPGFDITGLSALEILDSRGGRTWSTLAEVDQAVIDLDGTPGKIRLGANAVVGGVDGAGPCAGCVGWRAALALAGAARGNALPARALAASIRWRLSAR